MSFSKKQTEYFENASHRWNFKCGATRSGKTYMDYFVIPKRIRRVAGREGLNVILGNTRGTIQRNIIEPLQSIWGCGLVSDISSDNTAEMFGERVYCLGAEKLNQVDRLRGASIKYCYGDEVVTWNEEVFNMLKSRLDKPYSVFDGTCNPDSPSHWLNTFFKSDADIYLQSYTIDDNPFNSEEFVKNLKNEYRGTVYYDRYILGLWRAAEGAVYPSFCNNVQGFLISEPPKIDAAAVGVDFGGNGSAHAFVLTGFSENFSKVTALDEFYFKGITDPKGLEEEFIGFLKKNLKRYNILAVYCDSAESTLIRGFRNAVIREGLPVEVKNARKGSITDRIRFYNVLMSHGNYRIMKHCTQLIRAFSEAVWEQGSGCDRRLDNGSVNVDSLDAAEYSIEPFMNRVLDMLGRR